MKLYKIHLDSKVACSKNTDLTAWSFEFQWRACGWRSNLIGRKGLGNPICAIRNFGAGWDFRATEEGQQENKYDDVCAHVN